MSKGDSLKSSSDVVVLDGLDNGGAGGLVVAGRGHGVVDKDVGDLVVHVVLGRGSPGPPFGPGHDLGIGAAPGFIDLLAGSFIVCVKILVLSPLIS